MSSRRRLDAELVRRKLVGDPEQARAAIEEGRVTVAGAPATKATRLVAAGEPIVVHGPGPRFVSRGGEKLEAALDRFDLDVAGLRALDAGASTGGFTDCLLQRGAVEVIAVDVGYGQLHESLRADPRVRNLERTNIRHLDPSLVGEPVELVVADLSFISLRSALDALLGVAAPAASLALLVKPQFEADHQEVSKGRGVITDPEVWRRTLGEVIAALSERGAIMMSAMASPLPGADGNIEFLVWARAPGDPANPPAPADGSFAERTRLVEAAVIEAEAMRTGSEGS